MSTITEPIATLILESEIFIPSHGLPDRLFKFLRKKLVFRNPEHLMNERLGYSNWQTRRWIYALRKYEDGIVVPAGLLEEIKSWAEENGVSIDIGDRRQALKGVRITSSIELRADQERMLRKLLEYDRCVLEAQPGFGKTVVALQYIVKRRQPTLVIVHTRELLQQWKKCIEKNFTLKKGDVGISGDVAKVVLLIESKSESARGRYNSLGAGEVQQGAEQVVAFIDACRRAKLGEWSDFGALQECLARMVLSHTPFADFRSTNLDGDELVAKVSRALDDVGQETKRATRGVEFLLNHVVPPSQWPSSTKSIGSAQEAASQVQSFVSNTLKPFTGGVQAVGHPEHFIARQGWRVPVTLKAEDGQEYQGEVTIYDNGEIMQRTRGMLRQTFGIAEKRDE